MKKGDQVKTEVATPFQIDEELIEELKGTLVEGETASRWELIKTYHRVGELLVINESVLPKDYIKIAAKALDRSDRLIYQTVQLYKAYPDVNALPFGKAASWHLIVNKLLPKPRKEKTTKEQRLENTINEFFRIKSVEPKMRPFAQQIIMEWESYKEEKKGKKKNNEKSA